MLRIAIAQFNAVVGDFKGNIEAISRLCNDAAGSGADMVIFPELSLCGYPPEDLLLKEHFLKDNQLAAEKLAGRCAGIIAVVGFARKHNGKCYNALAVLHNGGISGIYHKSRLPNYGVFDERRYFEPGKEPLTLDINGINIIFTICEDIWDIDRLEDFLKNTGQKDLIVNISASPFHTGKISERKIILSRCAKRFDCAVAYCNLIGGQDELVFDGQSMLLNNFGEVAAVAKAFEEDLLIAEIEKKSTGIDIRTDRPAAARSELLSDVYKALVLGTRDYVTKNGFKKVALGLSGGIDSALVAAIAAEALGAENVVGITMPSRFNSTETITDAQRTAEKLGIAFETIPISAMLSSANETLAAVEGWNSETLAYENLQARLRGCILMSLSNQFGYLILTTGNKSETAVGYSTLYGDTAGGFAVLKDVPKTMVYELSRYINKLRGREIIPESVITRPPSAELRLNQKDSDSLGDYDTLDKILKGYVEEDKSIQQLIDASLPEKIIKRIVRLIDRNEYKRRQSPPGVKITPKAFGRDRRLPITNAYTNCRENNDNNC
ncbi:MAG: NAD+ synthase [Planctomycetes bacterium]|nr:NAD+ synthase [Planctomycetota bacterium]